MCIELISQDGGNESISFGSVGLLNSFYSIIICP